MNELDFDLAFKIPKREKYNNIIQRAMAGQNDQEETDRQLMLEMFNERYAQPVERADRRKVLVAYNDGTGLKEYRLIDSQDAGEKAEIVLDAGMIKRGGEGSGFHGHAGRPGKVGGSAPRSGALGDPINGNGWKESCGMAAEMIQDKHVEHAYCFSENGEFRWYDTDHKQASVEFSEEQWYQMSGGTLVHNHPWTGGPFSPEDVLTLQRSGLNRIIAVGGYTTFVMEFDRREYGTMDRDKADRYWRMWDTNYLQNKIFKYEREVKAKVNRMIDTGQIIPGTARYRELDMVWKRMEEDFPFINYYTQLTADFIAGKDTVLEDES